MKSAEELRNIAEKSAPNYAKTLLFPPPLKRRIADICDTRAREGLTYYTHIVTIDPAFPEDVFLAQCIEFIKDFEANGYKVSIMEKVGESNQFLITIFWLQARPHHICKVLNCDKILYTTMIDPSANNIEE